MPTAEYAVADAGVLDAVAEAANMVPGNVETALDKPPGSMGMSIPAAIYGKRCPARSFGGETWTAVVFDCQGHRLEVKPFWRRAPARRGHGHWKAMPAGLPVCLRA